MYFFSAINIYAWVALINFLLCTFFGFLIFFHNPRKRLYQTFLFLNIAIAIWSLGYFFWQISDTYSWALFWTRVLSIGSTLIPPTFLHWSLSLLGLYQKRKRGIFFFYAVSIVFLVFSFSDIFIRSVEPTLFFRFWPKPGILYSLYLFFVYVPLVLYGNYLIFAKYKDSRGIEKSKLRWVFLGTAIAFAGGSTNFLLWYNIPIPPVGNFLVAAYPLFFSYSVTRYRFMDIRSLINRSITFGLVVLIITASFTALSVTIGDYLEPRLPIRADLVVGFIVGLLVTIVYQPLRKFIEQGTSRFLYKKRYDPNKLLASITNATSTILELKLLLKTIATNLDAAFNPSKSGFALLNKEGRLEVAYVAGMPKIAAEELAKGKEEVMSKEFKRSREILVVDEAVTKLEAGEYESFDEKLLYAMHEVGVALIIPLFSKDKLIGIYALGTKKSGDPYTQQDLSLLGIISSQTAIAIENAQLYDELRDFNITLQKRVEEATRDLRVANTKLLELDRTKSEFISIASHQLRTPLTVIKGYVSMTREGSFGKVSPIIMEKLEKVYIANERLIGLVENLLDISRIESGRQQFNWEKVEVEKLAADVIEELKHNAEVKGLKLTWHQPKKALPKVKADRNKLHEVIMNFIDNSIKYTKEGTIDVSIYPTDDGKHITFSVKDTSIGIGKETLPYLFQKFSRGKGSFKVHTEGTGLGLFVARMIVEAHHGILGVESGGPGTGTHFFFTLPVEGPDLTNYKPSEPIHRFLSKKIDKKK